MKLSDHHEHFCTGCNGKANTSIPPLPLFLWDIRFGNMGEDCLGLFGLVLFGFIFWGDYLEVLFWSLFLGVVGFLVFIR